MINGEILYNFYNMKDGEAIKVYSQVKDLFLNEKIDIYTFVMEKGNLYLIFSKKTSIDGTGGYYSKDKVKNVGVSEFNISKYEEMNLTTVEIDTLKDSTFEYNLIRRGYTLQGVFENGFTFKYPNIILVTNENISDK